MYPTLGEFVDALEQAGELHRITVPVSPILEVTAIADRISKSPAPYISENRQTNSTLDSQGQAAKPCCLRM